ncbi:hydroxymethylpyrimidine/phosphomethylpyrimidine kinase [Pararhizobium haloflavum]|uniref:hydroxymethylpyrimidine/phosphomethylpyrimidine kinase n=1 Tax=Pararhizobium haloflavum TaxID=2037914 RepID=UPI001FE11CEF|nr:hydroxymethylpyrimidine/phosphomethylpyrimidine kinase [Pararhizobium haloflavum]
MSGAPQVLVVAGSDSSGGAGIVRDVETLAAFAVKACVAVTAVSEQTHDRAGSIETIDAPLIAAQMRAALEANDVGAIKIGLLRDAASIAAVADVLASVRTIPVVVDPVLLSSSGRRLASAETVEALRQRLFPLCRLATPNRHELAELSGRAEAEDEAMADEQARMVLSATGLPALLAKGGHGATQDARDLLYEGQGLTATFTAPRRSGTMRGTGCMLSSAIAASLAMGAPLTEAIVAAKRYVGESWPD